MKKFVKFFSLIMIGIYLIWFGCMSLFPVYFKGIDYLSWEYKLNQISLKELKGATVMLGDSTVEAAFNPTLVNAKEPVYNLALSGASPFDSYLFVKRLLESGNIPKRVFISFSIYNFVLHEGILQRNLNFGLYDFNEVSEVIEWQRNNEFLYKELEQFGNLSVYFPFSLLLNPDTLSGKIRMSYLEYFLSKARLSLIDYNRFKRFLSKRMKIKGNEINSNKQDLVRFNGHIGYKPVPYDLLEYPLQILSQSSFPLHKFSKHFLEKTLKMLNEADIPVIMPYSPMPEKYYKVLNDDFKKSFKAFYSDLKKRFNIQIDEAIPWYPQEQLIDKIHLNPKGVKAFSERLGKRYF